MQTNRPDSLQPFLNIVMGLKLEDEATCTHTVLAGIRSRSGGFNGSYKGLDSLVLVLGFEVFGTEDSKILEAL